MKSVVAQEEGGIALTDVFVDRLSVMNGAVAG
jgi:hypothetical protein